MKRLTLEIEQSFFRVIKELVLRNGRIDSETAVWLREILFADGLIDTHKREFLEELKREAEQVSKEFGNLVTECASKSSEEFAIERAQMASTNQNFGERNDKSRQVAGK